MQAPRAFGRQAGSDSHFQDAGDRCDPFLELLVHGANLRGVGGALVLDWHAEGENVAPANTQIDLRDVPETAEDQSRARD